MSLFAQLAQEWAPDDSDKAAWYRELAGHPVEGDRSPEPTVLEEGQVADLDGPVECNQLLTKWLGSRDKRRRSHALGLVEALHGFEMERASRPPQVSVSIPVTVASRPADSGDEPETVAIPVPQGSPGSAVLPAPVSVPSSGLVETTHQLRALVRWRLHFR
jgi:hypothetical protein